MCCLANPLWLLAECSEGNAHFAGFMHTCKVSSSPAARLLGYVVDTDYQRSSVAVLSLSLHMMEAPPGPNKGERLSDREPESNKQ